MNHIVKFDQKLHACSQNVTHINMTLQHQMIYLAEQSLPVSCISEMHMHVENPPCIHFKA